MTDIGHGIDIAAAIDLGLHLHALAETPIAFDDGVGCIDAVNDHGHPDAAGNHDIETTGGKSRGRRSDQKSQCDCSAHGCGSQL
jgi:hypothetical protein